MSNDNDQSLDRAALRLDGLEVYAVVGALQAGTSVAMMQEVSTSSIDMNQSLINMDTLLQVSFLLTGTAASLGGIYATIMFALCSLYGKTALGMNKDRMYAYFMKVTGPHRMRAFTAFTSSLLLFCIQVVMLFGMKSPSTVRIPVVLGICTAIYYGRKDCNSLIEAEIYFFEKSCKF
jgi:hypothetical protein